MSKSFKTALGVGMKKPTRKPSEVSTISASTNTSFIKTPKNTIMDTEDDDNEDARTIEESNTSNIREEPREVYVTDDDDDDDEEEEEEEEEEGAENDPSVIPIRAPTAKVIVSDKMMTEAMTEINSRRSSRSLLVPHTTVSTPSRGSNAGAGKGGDGDASTALRLYQGENDEEAGGGVSTLEKVLEFLNAVMAKEYDKAFGLAIEVETLEPDNELIQEYKHVLSKIVKRGMRNEKGDEDSGSDDDVGRGVKYTDEFSSSSETESVSGKDYGVPRTSSTSSSSEEENNVDEEETKEKDKLESEDIKDKKDETIVLNTKETEPDGGDGPSVHEDDFSVLSDSLQETPQPQDPGKKPMNNFNINFPAKAMPEPFKKGKKAGGGDATASSAKEKKPLTVKEKKIEPESKITGPKAKSKAKKKLVKKKKSITTENKVK